MTELTVGRIATSLAEATNGDHRCFYREAEERLREIIVEARRIIDEAIRDREWEADPGYRALTTRLITALVDARKVMG